MRPSHVVVSGSRRLRSHNSSGQIFLCTRFFFFMPHDQYNSDFFLKFDLGLFHLWIYIRYVYDAHPHTSDPFFIKSPQFPQSFTDQHNKPNKVGLQEANANGGHTTYGLFFFPPPPKIIKLLDYFGKEMRLSCTLFDRNRDSLSKN